MRRSLLALALSLVALGTVGATGAQAAEELTIAHVEHADDTLSVLVSVPRDVEPDLESATLSIGGVDTDATAELATTTTTVRRTTVLAIDTSNSMRGQRFTAAKAAATAFLDVVPDDVRVGIVTFDSEVATPLQPTLDRAAARAVIDQLSLRLKTRLYDGVLAGVEMAGTDGQRQLLILSDGADTSDTELSVVTQAIQVAQVLTDVVSLEQAGAVEPLQEMAAAGDGKVISAESEQLAEAFSAEADVLARQVLVQGAVPDSVTGSDATVAISLVAGGQTMSADIFAPIRDRANVDVSGPSVPRTAHSALEIPMWAVYGGVGLLGVGLLGLLWMLTLSMTRAVDLTPEARIVQYAEGRGRTPTQTADKSPEQALSQAKDVAAGVLSRNKSLEVRIARRLDAAGSDFKPAEWLLLHGGIVVAAGLLGLLIGGGSLVTGMLFLVFGLVLPWLWLGFRRKRRLKAFGALLPDTLQLMSGSLSAGLSLAQSVDTIVREGNEPMRSEFKRVLVETRLGVPLEDALEGVTERFDSKDFAWVVMAIKIQRQVGGNLGELLNTVAGTIREREYLRRQVSTLSAEGRLSAWVLGLLPPLFGLYLFLTQPDYFGVMLSDPRGWLMIGGAALMLSVGAFWMSRLVKVEV